MSTNNRANRRRTARLESLGATGLAIALVTALPHTATASPGQDATSLREISATDLAAALAGENVTITNATFTGADFQAGLLSGFDSALLVPSQQTGVALSTGSVIDPNPASPDDVDFTRSSLIGPNTSLTTTGDLGLPGHPALDTQSGATTYDAAVLTLEVVPAGATLSLGYVFGSEEYGGGDGGTSTSNPNPGGSWAERGYGDAFAITVDGELCSTVPGTDSPVGTTTVVEGSPQIVTNFEGTDPAAGGYDTELNAFTVPMTCETQVTPGEAVSVQIAVADTLDGHLDSAVVLTGASLVSTDVPPEPTPEPTPTPTPTDEPTDPAPSPSDPGPGAGTGDGTGGPNGGAGGKGLAYTGADIAGMITLAVGLLGTGAGAWWYARRRGVIAS